ncbi:hypothetical protein ABZ357_15020 [Streptomyces sp. NPDC005917]|uniref:hypothetical protein n=1 Tax=unclassified Streptomyces TaxID=2593676 RepID=UPI0033DB9544
MATAIISVLSPGRIDQLGVAGTYVLTSAQRDQVAVALSEEERTAFSGRLIRLLREGVVGGPSGIGSPAPAARLAPPPDHEPHVWAMS